ncbi:glutamate receptor [Trifolium pratense]|uniref:Glutamate receptor n=1 Tax=Trifolium pratense TaxID=57577 RepID=A0A2K3LWT5_TRIPR|nr:glutamate receptor [Trifolium pratense]
MFLSRANSNHRNDLPSTVSVKLDRDNYPLWKSMVLPIIKGAKLDGYMLGKKECPEEFTTATDSSKKISNPEFEDWQAYDQQLLGWLRNSMTVGIATQLLHCETSMQLWEEAQSLAGNPVSTSDLIIQTLNGLDSEYNPVVVKLSDQTTLSWVDLQAQLLTFESRIEQLNSLSNLTLNATANVVNKSDHRGNKFNSNINWRGSNFRGWKGGSGRGRSSKTSCQVCGLGNHIAIDKTYSRSNYDKQRSHNAFVASRNSVQDYDWYFDSGASNHVTHQSDKFQDLTEHHVSTCQCRVNIINDFRKKDLEVMKAISGANGNLARRITLIQLEIHIQHN